MSEQVIVLVITVLICTLLEVIISITILYHYHYRRSPLSILIILGTALIGTWVYSLIYIYNYWSHLNFNLHGSNFISVLLCIFISLPMISIWSIAIFSHEVPPIISPIKKYICRKFNLMNNQIYKYRLINKLNNLDKVINKYRNNLKDNSREVNH